ncbi:MAG: hypothetical protein K2O57_09680, partial [Acetatifactor sp.]|nr:hypothetical protein [Acetatifactor sp.]
FLIVRAGDQGEMRMDAHFRFYGAWMHLRTDPQIARFYHSTIRKHPTAAACQTIPVFLPRHCWNSIRDISS